MYVCICNNVRESDIDLAIADGAISLKCVEQRLGVGSCCGQCVPRAVEYLEQALPDSDAPSMVTESSASDPINNLKILKVTSINANQTSPWRQSIPGQLQNNFS